MEGPGPKAREDEVMTEDERVTRPKDRIEALLRIEAAVREIEMICDEFGMDPAQWLVIGGSDE